MTLGEVCLPLDFMFFLNIKNVAVMASRGPQPRSPTAP